MKFIVLFVALAAVLPFAGWLRSNPRKMPAVWTLMGILPWVVTMGPHPLYLAIISWPQWPGYVKGTEVSVIDILALAIFLSRPRARTSLPFQFSMAFYFLTVLLSALPAGAYMAALFYPWQLARMFLLYAVVTRACTDDRAVQSLLNGLAIGLCIQACFAIWDRVDLGILQAGGGVGDKNLLGMMSHFALFPLLAFLLAGQRGKLAFLGPLAAAIITVLTVSRATVGLNLGGAGILLILSIMRKRTPRKSMVASACVAGIFILAPFAFSSFEARFSEHPISADGYNERAAFDAAAKMMLSDHPMGVGANNYIVVANTAGYDDRAGVSWAYGSRSTSVHNTYLLAAAETGYLGIIAFVLFLSRPLVAAFICGWRNRHDPRGDLLLGLGVALLTSYAHAYYEWIFFAFQTQYLFTITVGLVAGLTQQLGYWGNRARQASDKNNFGDIAFGKASGVLTSFRSKRTTF